MADFNKGQTFLDIAAVNYYSSKPKYFITMSDADYDDDLIVCFVMNTEHRTDKYRVGCNKDYQRFIIEPGTFSFVTEHTSIMLLRESLYKYSEMYGDKIKLLDIAGDLLVRQIRNCIDWNNLTAKATRLIKDSFK